MKTLAEDVVDERNAALDRAEKAESLIAEALKTATDRGLKPAYSYGKVKTPADFIADLFHDLANARAAKEDALEAYHRIAEQRDALEAFKAYVHKRLDEAGIPANPGGPHTEQGCRVGDRLDLLIGRVERLRGTIRYMAEIHADRDGHYTLPDGMCIGPACFHAVKP